MRIALFVTCLADTLFPDVGKATVRLLERLGHDVVFPPEQTLTLADEVSDALMSRGARTVVVPPELGVPLPAFAAATIDDGLTAAELDAFDAVVTGAAVAIAETGTMVLDGAPDQGRRAISLVPDYHLCIVRNDQVVHLVPADDVDQRTVGDE